MAYRLSGRGLLGRRGDLINHLEPDFLGRSHRLQHAGHDLGRARAAHLVGRLRFKQLGVRQNNAELVVEAVKEQSKVRCLVHLDHSPSALPL